MMHFNHVTWNSEFIGSDSVRLSFKKIEVGLVDN